MYKRITLLILVSVSASAELVGKAYELTTHPATVRIRQEGPLPATCEPTLHAARGEYESLQISLTGLNRLSDLDAAISPFANAASEQLPANSATLYRVEYVPIRFSAPRATEAPGLTPDPLVPFIDPYTGKKCASPLWTGEEKLEVKFEALKDTRVPALLTVSEQSRRMEDMMKTQMKSGLDATLATMKKAIARK